MKVTLFKIAAKIVPVAAIAAKIIPVTLIALILIGTLTDFRAEMYNLGGENGKTAGDNNIPTTTGGNDGVRRTSGINGNGFVNETGITKETGIVNDFRSQTGMFINPLTGVSTANDISRNRPVAVSVSNVRQALPSNATNGISQADIVYEVLVESGITRMVAIYQDFSNVGVVGSIRSARHYKVEIAEAYDAMFVHAGGSPLGFEEIENRDITNFDEVRGVRGQIFKRDVNRIPGHTVQNYHSATTSGASFMQWLPTYNIRTTHNSNFRQALNFTDNPIPSGNKAHSVGVKFSSAKDSIFIYEESQNKYHMAQFGSYFTDANNNNSVTFTNLLILEMPVADLVGHGEGAGRQDMSTVGSGKGYFASNGRIISINWQRADKSSQFIYTDGNGNQIELGRGKTYIGIVPNLASTVVS